jgi:predicted RNase H-like HicB family nuclease
VGVEEVRARLEEALQLVEEGPKGR